MLNVARLKVLKEVAYRGSFSAAADGAVLHPVGRLPADRRARGRNRDRAARAPPPRRQPDGGRTDARRARRGHPRAPGGRRGGAGGDRGPARRAPAGGLLPDRRRDADAAGDRDVPLLLPRRRADARRGRARGDRRRACAPASSTSRCCSSSPARASAAGGRRARGAARGPDVPGAARASTRWPGARRSACEDLAGEAWVQTSRSSPCARHVVRSCHAAGFEPNVAFESDDYQTVQGLVAAGVGVALIPELALSVVREDIVIRALSPAPPIAPGDRRRSRRRAPRARRAGDAGHARRGRPASCDEPGRPADLRRSAPFAALCRSALVGPVAQSIIWRGWLRTLRRPASPSAL